jgi:hypothetical protein
MHSRLTSIGAGTELDERVKARLDKLSVQLGRIERDQQTVAETLALLPDFSSMVAAPSSNSDRAARGLPQERFKLFIEQVTRRISNGHGLVDDVLSLTSPAETNYEL